jgi:hypothetical protein
MLTATTTEFKDPIYALTYPAHWPYEGTGGGYKDVGLNVPLNTSVVNAAGNIADASYKSLLTPGDEISLISSGNAPKRAWIVNTLGQYQIMLENSGVALNQTSLLAYSGFVVVRSGRHNLQDLKVGAITSLVNPLNAAPNYWPTLNQNYEILNATSVEMGNNWGMYCGCGQPPVNPGDPFNPYQEGVLGNWRKVKDYTYLTLRKQEKVNENSNIRKDGTFANFSPFYTPNGANSWNINPANWQWVSEVTKTSPYGAELENKDALNRYSSAQFGYQQTLPVAISSNSKYKQMANENFEYTDLNFCPDNHFGFNAFGPNTYMTPTAGQVQKVQKFSHTGKRSIKVEAASTQNIEISKQLLNCPQ